MYPIFRQYTKDYFSALLGFDSNFCLEQNNRKISSTLYIPFAYWSIVHVYPGIRAVRSCKTQAYEKLARGLTKFIFQAYNKGVYQTFRISVFPCLILSKRLCIRLQYLLIFQVLTDADWRLDNQQSVYYLSLYD